MEVLRKWVDNFLHYTFTTMFNNFRSKNIHSLLILCLKLTLDVPVDVARQQPIILLLTLYGEG